MTPTETSVDPSAIHRAPDHGEASYSGSGLLSGRVAVVTGGGSGIGRAVAIAFAREGADVVVAYFHGDDDARQTADHVEGAGRRARLFSGDLGDEGTCDALVREAVDAFGRIDILVNNAAMQRVHGRIEDLSTEDWDAMFRANIYAPFFLCRAAVPHMPPGSSIINTTSLQAKSPSPNLVGYAATKGALVTFTAALGLQLAERGIRVNAVAPGPIWTPLIAETFDDDHNRAFGKGSPFDRPGQPGELAGAYVLLASDRSSYMTGAVVPVTGGSLML